MGKSPTFETFIVVYECYYDKRDHLTNINKLILAEKETFQLLEPEQNTKTKWCFYHYTKINPFFKTF